tara:strand:- start:26838 stop:27191 length:354 start_codon:yes stop_codon:yes gene_type:complete
MKQISVILLMFFCVGFGFASNIDDDVGVDLEITTMKIEVVKHQMKIQSGFEFVAMTIKSDQNGVFLVIDYRKDEKMNFYCWNYIEDFPEKEKPIKINQNFLPEIVFHSSGGNPYNQI